MSTAIKQLSTKYKLNFESPFSIQINGKEHIFQYLLKGYGAKLGMVLDEDWKKIEPVANELIELGFGFSCIDIDLLKIYDDTNDSFQEVLDDWGKIDNTLPNDEK